MKKIFGLVISLFVLTGCGTNMGTVMPMGDGVYTLTGNGRSGYVPLGSIRKKVFKEADEYATERNATFEVISVNEVKTGFAIWPQIDLTFRLVNKSEKLANPNIESTTIIKSKSGNGETTTKQTISKKNNAEKDDEKYDRLLKLGKLKEEGLLTEEEFQKEKTKILNDE